MTKGEPLGRRILRREMIEDERRLRSTMPPDLAFAKACGLSPDYEPEFLCQLFALIGFLNDVQIVG